jgi:hypothetical protein
MKWNEPAVNRTLSALTTRKVNIFFMIVQRKVLKDVEVFVTTMMLWRKGKNINQKTALLI